MCNYYTVIHNSLCIQIYLNLSQPNDLIKSDIETIEAKFSLYNTHIPQDKLYINDESFRQITITLYIM